MHAPYLRVWCVALVTPCLVKRYKHPGKTQSESKVGINTAQNVTICSGFDCGPFSQWAAAKVVRTHCNLHVVSEDSAHWSESISLPALAPVDICPDLILPTKLAFAKFERHPLAASRWSLLIMYYRKSGNKTMQIDNQGLYLAYHRYPLALSPFLCSAKTYFYFYKIATNRVSKVVPQRYVKILLSTKWCIEHFSLLARIFYSDIVIQVKHCPDLFWLWQSKLKSKSRLAHRYTLTFETLRFSLTCWYCNHHSRAYHLLQSVAFPRID